MEDLLNLGEYRYLMGIPGSEKWIKVKLIGGGWSPDLKFKITTVDGFNYLIRVTDIKSIDKKKMEYESICELDTLGINFTNPYSFGTLDDVGKLYMVLRWVDGKNVEEAVPELTTQQQYECGVKAGKLLRKIHSLPSKLTPTEWKQKNLKILAERDNLYKACDYYKIEYYDEMMCFINANMKYLDNRPLVFHHGDFQGRNIIIDENGDIGVIDFERTSSGDPYEEFNRMMIYTRRFSVDFSRGQIDGYFENEKIPEEFFPIVAFHSAMKLLTTIVFGVTTKQEHIYKENELAKEVLYEDYKGFTSVVPSWYEAKD